MAHYTEKVGGGQVKKFHRHDPGNSVTTMVHIMGNYMPFLLSIRKNHGSIRYRTFCGPLVIRFMFQEFSGAVLH